MENLAGWRQQRITDDAIVTFLFGRFSDPEPIRGLVEATSGVLESLKRYKQREEVGIRDAHRHLALVAGTSGRVVGALRYLEDNWDGEVSQVAAARYRGVDHVREAFKETLGRMAREHDLGGTEPFVWDFVSHFGLRALADPRTLPTRWREVGEQAADGIVEVGRECREEVRRQVGPAWPLDIEAIYTDLYRLNAGHSPVARPWREIEWGNLRFDTALGSLDFNVTNVAKVVCQCCGILVTIAAAVGFLASLVTVNPILSSMTLKGLAVGPVVAISPGAAMKLAEKVMGRKIV